MNMDMDQITNENINYYVIPANVNIGFEFTEGIGFKQLLIIGIGLIIGLVLYGLASIPEVTVAIPEAELSYGQRAAVTNGELELNEDGILIADIKKVPSVVRLIILASVPVFTYYLVKPDTYTHQSKFEQIINYILYHQRPRKYLYIYWRNE